MLLRKCDAKKQIQGREHKIMNCKNMHEEEWGLESYQVFFLPFVFKQACKKNLTEIVMTLKFNDLK